MDSLKLYYCNISNFGDELNKSIFNNVLKAQFTYLDIENANFIGIGSILDKLLSRHFEFLKPKSKEKLVIYSSGFGFDKNYYCQKFKYAKPLKLRRNIDILALRGKLTKNILEELIKKPLDNIVLGDAGLLAGKLLDSPINKKYDVGIVPHFADKENEIFSLLTKNIPNSIILDTTEPVMDFIRHLSECRTIISTAMHPLIAADSLNIPNLWVRISEQTTSRFKFSDYYSIFDIEPKPIMLQDLNFDISKEYIEDSYKVPYSKVIEVQNNLVNVFKERINKD